MVKLKFETEDAKLGLTKAAGFLWADQKGIHIEYQISDNIFELYKSDIKEAFFPFTTIDEITHKQSWWLFNGGRICISLNSLKNTTDIPFMEDNDMLFNLKRKNKNKGKDFAVNTQLELCNYRLDELNTI
mgnify:CR=1 FL=1